MSQLSTTTAPATTRPRPRIVLRWMASFTGYPLGGFATLLLLGPVDDLRTALAGGLLTGAILGAVQVATMGWAIGEARPRPLAWIVATAAGLTTGLALGAALVDYRTGLGDLALQGAISGALVGAAQAGVLLPRLGVLALVWPLALTGVWALGWTITTAAGIGVDDQFTVFGSSGAIVATLLTAVLPVVLTRTHTEKSAS